MKLINLYSKINSISTEKLYDIYQTGTFWPVDKTSLTNAFKRIKVRKSGLPCSVLTLKE